uniref:Uncharacterized protein n=1 Tax=Arundo donax TaxID=35708 RepID=A0A0A9A596_ARUDO
MNTKLKFKTLVEVKLLKHKCPKSHWLNS